MPAWPGQPLIRVRHWQLPLLIGAWALGQTPNVADVLCPVVIGRDAELRALRAALAAACAGQGGVMFLTGEAGIGKSRLAREVSARARDLGAAVVAGRGVPSAASGPYRPLTEAVLQALRRRPLPDDPGFVPWLPALAAIVPTLQGEGHGEASAAVRGEAVIQLLGRLAHPGGMVMVLEDLHWADPDTLAVVEYLGDNLSHEPVLCVATIRSEPPCAALELAGRLHQRRAAHHLRLGRLTRLCCTLPDCSTSRRDAPSSRERSWYRAIASSRWGRP